MENVLERERRISSEIRLPTSTVNHGSIEDLMELSFGGVVRLEVSFPRSYGSPNLEQRGGRGNRFSARWSAAATTED